MVAQALLGHNLQFFRNEARQQAKRELGAQMASLQEAGNQDTGRGLGARAPYSTPSYSGQSLVSRGLSQNQEKPGGTGFQPVRGTGKMPVPPKTS